MTWRELLEALQNRVGRGQVTTYGHCSRWAFGHGNGGPAIVAMLNAMARRGHQVCSNRVVQDDGGIADQANQAHGQRSQLQAEGVPLDPHNRVDFRRCPAVVLMGTASKPSESGTTDKTASTRLLDLLAGWSAYISADEENSLQDPALAVEEIGELYQSAGQESETWLEISEANQEEAVRAFVNERVLPLLIRGRTTRRV